MSWVPGGLRVALEELISPNKPGEALTGPVCSSPPSLAPGWVSFVTAALHRCHRPWLGRLGRLQWGGRHLQLPAAFPTRLRCWDLRQWDREVCGIVGRGFLGSASALRGRCRVAVHRAPALGRETPRVWQGNSGYSRARLRGPIPSLAFVHMEILMKLWDSLHGRVMP